MKQIVNENMKIERKVVSRDEAKELFSNDEYKLELIDAIPEDENVTLYSQGDFTDLCRGVHVPSTAKIKEFKLLSTAGAYWQEIVTTKCYNVYTVLLSLIKRIKSTFTNVRRA